MCIVSNCHSLEWKYTETKHFRINCCFWRYFCRSYNVHRVFFSLTIKELSKLLVQIQTLGWWTGEAWFRRHECAFRKGWLCTMLSGKSRHL